MCVASGVSITRTISSSTRDGNTVEQPTATTEQHRDLVDLQLVQHTGLERPLRRVRAVHHHVPVPGGGLRLCHRAGDPVESRTSPTDSSPPSDRAAGDWARRSGRRDDHRPSDRPAPRCADPPAPRRSAFHLVPQLPGRPGRPAELPSGVDDPLVQPVEVVAAGVVRPVVRTRDVPVERHRHVEHG